MDIKLLMHNEVALEKLNVHLKTNQFSTINHATGTGKSFIALKYTYQNKEKRILYLSPTYPIFTQLVKKHMKTLGINSDNFEKFDHMIYRNLMGFDMEALAKEYDIIICDEYHRCGARKWGKKVKELKEILKQKYPDKKMIGLTATPKRYLDDERNMTNELFDGKCASTLDLSDAIIQGLLPAPVYICTLIDYKDNITNIKEKIEKNVIYKRDKEKYSEVLNNVCSVVDEINKQDCSFEKYIKKENGKYIAFNPTIQSIKNNKRKIQQWFGDKKINFFEVHSGNSSEKNEEILQAFENSNSGINILCAVDILNEGIHVSGIDGILMLRKTTSPIIYFQQLGRLLSYSGRKDELVVWDLVGNLMHHKAITDLYSDVQQRARKLISRNPSDKQRYSTILERFKIIDNATQIVQSINKLNECVSKDNIIRQRISTAVDILTGKLTPFSYDEKIQAHIDLYKYSKYVTLDMHKQLSKLGIVMPNALEISNEEFEKQLCGYKCVHDLTVGNNKKIVLEFEEYFNKKDRVPKITSEDEKEAFLAKKIVDSSYKFSGELLKKLRSIVKKDFTLTPYDYAFYGIDVKPRQLDIFAKQVEENMEKPNKISKYIIECLRKNRLNDKYDFEYYLYRIKQFSISSETSNDSKRSKLLKELIDFSKRKQGKIPEYNSQDKEEQRLFLELNSMQDSFIKKYTEIISSDMYKIYGVEDEKIIKEKVEQICEEIILFVNKKCRYPKQTDEEQDLYCKFIGFKELLIKYGYKQKIDELIALRKKEELDKRINAMISNLIIFIKQNKGDLPSIKVNDSKEVSLAKEYKKLMRYLTTEQKETINNEICNAKVDDNLVDLYVDFIIKYRRYPLINSTDEYEKNLQARYIRNVDKLSKEDNIRIKRALSELNKKSVMKNTFSELYKKGMFK